MTSSRILERWTTIAALFVLIMQIVPGPVAAAATTQELLSPTPLVLKDGRIANVSIHLLPFETDQDELAGDTAARLAGLTAQLANDCFLTAQVIGHVSSREIAENETLAAHRLARARADAVQASLIGGGLPAKAIASVWDWQFLVREPRATLWVFRLIKGEDCEGLPLEGDASGLVAENDAAEGAQPAQPIPAKVPPAREVAQAPQAVEPARPAQAEEAATLPPMVASAVAAEPEASEVAAEARPEDDTLVQAQAPQQQAARPQQGGDRLAAPTGSAQDAAPTVTRPLPALSPSQPAARAAASSDAGAIAVAAVEPETQQDADQDHPERRGKVEWGQDGNVVITFATNSSYFPPGAARRLRSLIGNLSSGKHYRVQLEVGVSGSDTVVGANSPEEARRYNKWLAERRMARVQEWLAENAKDRQLEIEPVFQADDSSRRVVVRVASVS